MVKLNNEYIVRVDENNYTLMRDRKKFDKEGRPLYETIGYYADLAQAVNGAIQHTTRCRLSEGVCDLCKAIRIIRECNAEFKDLLKELMEEKHD